MRLLSKTHSLVANLATVFLRGSSCVGTLRFNKAADPTADTILVGVPGARTTMFSTPSG